MSTRAGWLSVVWLLLGVAFRRMRARLRTNALRSRAGSPGLLYAITLFGTTFLLVMLGVSLGAMVNIATDITAEKSGHYSISGYIYEKLQDYDVRASEHRAFVAAVQHAAGTERAYSADDIDAEDEEWSSTVENYAEYFEWAATRMVRTHGGSEAEWRERLKAAFQDKGAAAFVTAPDGWHENPSPDAYAVLTLLLALWWLSMVLQGDGAAFDTTRRRHPMWEWFLAFPVPQSAVFVAEALTPMAANPAMLASPLLIAILIGTHEGSVGAGIAGFAVGIPLVLSAAIAAKSVDVLVMLRSSARNRAGWFVLFGATGLLASLLPIVLYQAPALSRRLIEAILPLAEWLPSAQPLLAAGSPFGWARAMSVSVLVSSALAAPAFLILKFAIARGLDGSFGSSAAVVSTNAFRAPAAGRMGWWSDPLLRKEMLWLRRDRGALVQLIGVPLLLVGVQFINLQNVLRDVELSWNKLAGVVVGMGAYLLFVSGPRALLSEGPALALTLTWPRSLEDTLRTKVRVLFAIVSAMVEICLIIIMWMFPDDVAKLLLVALGWLLFGWSVSEKAVTLIRRPSQSGDSDALPQSQLWIASLGNFTFAIGLFTAQWQLVIAAIVLNWIFASALWEGFRIRLAFLFDPDSEPAMRPPTVLSSVLAVVGLMEASAVIGILSLWAFGTEGRLFAQVVAYGLSAVLVSAIVWNWHAKHGVSLAEIALPKPGASANQIGFILLGGAIGAVLGAAGLAYQQWLLYAPWPEISKPVQQSLEFLDRMPELRFNYAIMAIGIAPWVEEFIFRGLLFRAMRVRWGLIGAVLASSAFFTLLHPAFSWPMVFLLGATNALLFHRSGSLLPCILLHLVYNAIVVGCRI
ncbi:MAG: type II CAAX endopeptidase family protein [Tahibacter sp.]